MFTLLYDSRFGEITFLIYLLYQTEKLTVHVIDVVDTNLRVKPCFPSPWQFIPNAIRKRQGLR